MVRTPWRLPLFLLCLLALGLVALLPALGDPASILQAEELEEGGEKEGEGEPDEEGVDLGEKVSFSDRINKAIELGVKWLKQRPDRFEIKKGKVAHWGLIKGDRAYGGREGIMYQHPIGPTSLALYTLLKCGVDPKDDVIKDGFRWLKERHELTMKWDGLPGKGAIHAPIDIVSSYEVSAAVLALTAKHDKYKKNSASRSAGKKGKLKMSGADKKWLVALVEGLVLRRGRPQPEGGDANRGWRYNVNTIPNVINTQNPPHANQDLSSTQLAALALFSADRFGVRVKPQVWLDIITFTLDHQEDSGPEHKRFTGSSKYDGPKDNARGFVYIKGSPDGHEGKATGSMTACGLTNLLIAREVLRGTKKGQKAWKAAGLSSRLEKGVWDSLAWLDRNWSEFENKTEGGKIGYHIYYLYALERAMDLLEKRLVGSHLWYEEGAKAILSRAQTELKEVKVKRNTELVETYFWNTQSTHRPHDVLDTCFALLFLKRSTRGMVPGGVVTGD